MVSNRGMEHHIDQRLTNLEIKASYTEDLFDQLDKVVVRQQQQIDLLIAEITRLRQQPAENAGGMARNPRDELPPHY